MKKIIVLSVMALFLLFLLCPPAFAGDNTLLSTLIPSEHTIAVRVSTGGRVVVGGLMYVSQNFTVDRGNTFSFTAVPNPGYELGNISVNSPGGIVLFGSGASIARVTKNVTFDVTFRLAPISEDDEPIPPDEGIITVPVVGEEESFNAQVAIAEDGTAQVIIRQEKLEELISEDSLATKVVIDLSSLEGLADSAAIPHSAVNEIGEAAVSEESGIEAMEIILPDSSSVTFNAQATKAIAEQGPKEEEDELILKVEKLEESKLPERLTDEQQEQIAELPPGALVLEVTLTYKKSGVVSDFKGGEAQVRIPYVPAENEDTSGIKVWFLSSDGHLEEYPCRYEAGFVIFTVNHFSNYIIQPGEILIPDVGDTEEAHCVICEFFGKNINPWCRIIPIAVVISIAAMVVWLIRKKKK